MNITVYLGSSDGVRPVYRQAATALGEWIGSAGHTLIYGGSNVGLMGVLADAVLSCGGKVIGVEPRFFMAEEIQHTSITELIVTDTMAQRKQKMIELGEAFVTFPGGVGTLEEITEVMTLAKLGRLNKPFVFLNIDGYYEPFRQLLQHIATEGFVESEWTEKIYYAATIADMASYLSMNR